jgi:hypothetical protein
MAPGRLVVRALLRAWLTVTVLVVLYFTLPITGPLDGSAAVRLVVGAADGHHRSRHPLPSQRSACVVGQDGWYRPGIVPYSVEAGHVGD